MSFADLDAVVAHASAKWLPPERMSLSDWADKHFLLPEGSASPGPWRTLPYQREILDAISDPLVEQVTIIKSSQVGYTSMMSAAIGYFIAQEPSAVLVVQPTVEDAKNFSKETIAPMLRDVPVLAGIMYRDVEERGPRDPSATIRQKQYPGGGLSLVGANSGTGFRRWNKRVVMFDEVDAYPPSAGTEGDPVNLGVMRTVSFHDRKIVAGSTPLLAGVSRIEEMFLAGDQRRFHVPCPQCDYGDIMVFHEGDRGHFLRWPDGRPEDAFYVCRNNGCVIEHRYKRQMVEHGLWINERPASKHRSFKIWSAYSYSPHASWGQIAVDFVEAKKGGPEKMKTYVNTVLGETWAERGDAPDWERLYQRREKYPIGSAPAGVRFLTAGVDVQKDRFVYEVVGWSANKENWSVDAGVLLGDTSKEESWAQLDELLTRTFPGEGRDFTIAMLAIDSGYNTQVVYNWCRRYPMNRVIAVKGRRDARALIDRPSVIDINQRGRRFAGGYRVWGVGVSIAKSELYGWLRLPRPAEGPAPAGYCHFPEYGETFFMELTAEHLVTSTRKRGYTVLEWAQIPNRENHALDARVYARAAASVLGLDRHAPRAPRPTSPAPEQATAPPSQAEAAGPTPAPTTGPGARPGRPPRPGGWLGKGRPGGWLGKRR